MEFINDIVNKAGHVTSLNSGSFQLATNLTLKMSGFEKTSLKTYSRDKLSSNNVGKRQVLGDALSEYNKAFSRNASLRDRHCAMNSFTVFGPKCTWLLDGGVNSTSGLNPLMTDVDGNIDDKALAAEMLLISPQIEIQRSRVNKMIETWSGRSMYDNGTALFVRLYQMMQISLLHDLTTKETRLLNVPAIDLLGMATVDDIAEYLADRFDSMKNQLGVISKDDIVYDNMAAKLRLQAAKTPAGALLLKKNLTEMELVTVRNASFSLEYEVYICEKYDDGHNVSGPMLYNECGFRHSAVMVSGQTNFTSDDDPVMLKHTTLWSNYDETSIASNFSAYAHLNCTNLSYTEYNILNHALVPHKRLTPFLIDQDICVVPMNEHVNAYGHQKIDLGRTSYSAREVASLIRKLVVSHNWYEDARAAYHALLFWGAQPAMESFEAQWWVTQPRILNLPRFGCCRGFAPCLTSGQGIKITRQALEDSANLYTMDTKFLHHSAAYNTLWFWGEYLSIINVDNPTKQEDLFSYGSALHMDNNVRALALMSAVTGLTVPTPTHKNIYTLMDAVDAEGMRRRVHFGTIDTLCASKCGYKLAESGVTIGKMVAPGGSALVTGLNGPLLRGTPLCSEFQYSVPFTVLSKRRGPQKKVVDFMSLWAMGVVSRWQGYDLSYRVTGAPDIHVCYSSNDTSLAAAPTSLIGTDKEDGYEILGLSDRDRIYGADIISDWDVQKSFVWHRSVSSGVRRDGRFVLLDDDELSVQPVVPTFVATYDGGKDYVSALVADYDSSEAFFQVRRMQIGLLSADTIDRSNYADVQDPTQSADPPADTAT
uniref:Coat protein n=1 Tax=Erysiphales associated totivirus 12 TaxID=2719842 RepID=A0A6G9ELJ9_9VIRU|nr:coat protein [Erysiphales associated totivirus 12]